MIRRKKPILGVLAAVLLAGCEAPPTTPPDEVAQGMAQAIADTKFYTEIALTRILGRHHDPAHDTWNIIACFDFVATDGSSGTNCLDSFNAKQLDNGGWQVSVTINEVYRWRVVGLPVDTPPEDEPGSPTVGE